MYLYGRSIDFGNSNVSNIASANIHFKWDEYTIKFTLISDLSYVLVMDDEEFEYIRKPID